MLVWEVVITPWTIALLVRGSMLKVAKPTIETPFHIDMEWWQEQGRDIRTELWSHLCSECRLNFASYKDTELIDWVDPDTGEVSRVDGLWHSLRTCCAEKPGFVASDVSLATAVFRLFLTNDNRPLTAVEIWQRLARRDPETILRILVSGQNYYGIRPLWDQES